MGNQLASVIQLKEKISTQQRRFSFEFVSSGFGVAREKKRLTSFHVGTCEFCGRYNKEKMDIWTTQSVEYGRLSHLHLCETR